MNESTSLYYKGGNSDKEYHLHLEALPDGLYMVRAQNGRRGGTLTSRDKTPKPVPHELALKKYQAVLREKLSEGYSQGAAGMAFVGTDKEQRITGIVPQLLNPIGDGDVERYLADAAFCLQEKHDGERRLVRRTGPAREDTHGINRKGLSVALPLTVVEALHADALPASFVADGELLGDMLAIFDLIELDGTDLRALAFSERMARLKPFQAVLESRQPASGACVTHTAFDEAGKRALYADLKARGVEGAVFKRSDAPYIPGRPHSGGDQVKRKFTHDATFIVASCSPTRRSVALALLDASGARVAMGNVTIPSNHEIPAAETLVDVNYLYAYPGGALAQPQYKGVRTDVEMTDCGVAQLHLKRDVGDEEDEAA